MDFTLIHEIGFCWWKEIISNNVRTDIIMRRSCSFISDIHLCQHTIIARLSITPSISRCRAYQCTLRLEVRIDRSPSCRIVVFHGKIVPIPILLRHWNSSLQCHTIELSLQKYSIIHSPGCDIFPILIDSF